MAALRFGVFMSFVALAASRIGPATVVKLNNGNDFPVLGLGTWLGFDKSGGLAQVQGNEVEEAVLTAIDLGYRHIDTASIYNTETLVGNAINKKISDGTIKREDIFVTTKDFGKSLDGDGLKLFIVELLGEGISISSSGLLQLWSDKHDKDAVVPALKDSLSKLNLEYVDLYLIHWPFALNANGSLSDIDYLETWQGMVEALNQGLTKSIGVSNFNQHQLDRLISLSSVKPAVLQVEINLNLQQPDLLACCRLWNITVTGYTPFGSLFYSKAAEDAPPPRVDDPALKKIADKYNKTVPQITLRYLIELGVVPIPKSVTKNRIEQNLDVFDFTLTQQERDLLKSYDRNYRTIAVKMFQASPFYPFEK